MKDKVSFLLLNRSSLDLIETHRQWLESQGVRLIGAPSCEQLDGDRLAHLMGGAHAVVGPPPAPVQLLPEHMAASQTLQVIALAASGYESVDIEAATHHGIVVTHASPPSLAEVVADYTWGMMLAVARQIPHHHRQLQDGNVQRGMGVALWGKTLGIVGLGSIGRRVARRAIGFEMRVLAADPEPDQEYSHRHDIELVPLDELLRRSDFVSLHLRLSPHTERMIGVRELGLMKPTAFLINTARQRLVDEVALTEAILRHQIAGAAIDDPPESSHSSLMDLPNVVRTPHIGNRVRESVDAVCRAAYQSALDVIQGRRPQFVLNPEVYERALRAPLPKGD